MKILEKTANISAIILNRENLGKKSIFHTLFYYFSEGFLIFFHRYSFIIKIIQPFFRKYMGWPKLALIHPGIECNRNCAYCYENEIKYLKESQLVIDDYIEIIREIKELGTTQIQILGREPMIYPELMKLLEIIKKFNIDTVIYTNGIDANKEMLDKMIPFRENLSFAWSLEYENIRGGKENFSESIKNLLMYRKKGFDIKLFITVTKQNFMTIPKLVKATYLKHGIIPVFTRYIPTGNKYTDRLFSLDAEKWYKILEIQKKIQKREKIVNIGKISAYLRGYGCSDYVDSIHIAYNGDVSPCDYVMNRIVLGNIRRSSLKKIWKIYNGKIRKWNKTPEKCMMCPEVFYCNGGRRSHSFILKGDFYDMDPLCRNFKCPLSY